MQVFDVTRLRDLTDTPATVDADVVYRGGGFDSAHNLHINTDTGFAYLVGGNTCAGGPHIVDVADPTNPTFVGCFAEDGYTHDLQCVVCHGPDVDYQGREICFASNEDTVAIVDVTDKWDMQLICTVGYANASYTHPGGQCSLLPAPDPGQSLTVPPACLERVR